MVIDTLKKISGRISFSGVFALYISVFIFGLLIPADLRSESDNWFDVAISGKPATLHIWEMDDAIGTVIVKNNIFEGLVRYNEEELKVEPHLAESWKVEQDGRVWVFAIRKGVRFHDGSPLTADDVIESIRKNKFFSGEVEKAGPLAVRFILPVKKAKFLKVLSRVNFFLEKTKEDGSIVGTGPFVLERWDGSNEIRMRAFRDYWGKPPAVDGVTFHCLVNPEKSQVMMRKGEIDVIYTLPPCLALEVKSDNGFALSVLEGASLCYIHINPERSPQDEPEFRRALNLAIDRKRLIRDIYCGQAIERRRFLPSVIGAASEEVSVIDYNPEEARRIIKKYLVDGKRVFKMIGLPFPRPYCPDPDALARLVIGYLKDVGLEIKYTRTHSWKDWLEMGAGDDYDFMVTGWVLDSRCPSEFYTSIFGIGNMHQTFSAYWENDLFESLILRAGETVSVRRSWMLYNRAEDLLFQEYPWIMLVHPNRLGAYRKSISGLKFSPIAEFRLGAVRKGD